MRTILLSLIWAVSTSYALRLCWYFFCSSTCLFLISASSLSSSVKSCLISIKFCLRFLSIFSSLIARLSSAFKISCFFGNDDFNLVDILDKVCRECFLFGFNLVLFIHFAFVNLFYFVPECFWLLEWLCFHRCGCYIFRWILCKWFNFIKFFFRHYCTVVA